MMFVVLVYRARRSEARIQQMLWKVNYSDIIFINTVCVVLVLVALLLEVGRVGNFAGYRIRVSGRYYPAGSG